METKIIEGFLGTDFTIKPIGRLDATTSIEFGTTVNGAIYDKDIKDLTLDFSEVPYVSSVGLRVLLELERHMKECGSMKLINVSKDVQEIFKMTGFDKILTVETK